MTSENVIQVSENRKANWSGLIESNLSNEELNAGNLYQNGQNFKPDTPYQV